MRNQHRRAMTREMYDALLRLADDGSPLVVDIEDYEVVEAKPNDASRADPARPKATRTAPHLHLPPEE